MKKICIYIFCTIIFFIIFSSNILLALPDSEVQKLYKTNQNFKSAEDRILNIWSNLPKNIKNKVKESQIYWINTERDKEANILIDNGISKADAYATVTNNRSDYLESLINKNNNNGDLYNKPKYTNSIGIEFILIQPGTLVESKKTKITIIKPFYISKYEVTQSQWEKVINKTVTNSDNKTRPIELSYHDAIMFINKLNKIENTTKYRLPTGDEWKYAARDYYDNFNHNYEECCWFYQNTKSQSKPVGKKNPNNFGLYDVYGNVREWIWAPENSGMFGDTRGGGWADSVYGDEKYSTHQENNNYYSTGMRLLLDID